MEAGLTQINVALMGGGAGAFIGPVHRSAMRLSGRFSIVAAALSADPQRAVDSGLSIGLSPSRCFHDYREMLGAARGDIDAVVITAPNSQHFPMAMAAVKSGLHVLCEKPLTGSLSEAARLAEEVKASKAVFCLAHTYRAYPMVLEMRSIVQSGRLGRIRRVCVEYTQGWLSKPIELGGSKQAAWRQDPGLAGSGGAIADIGSHAFNLAEYVSCEKVDRIIARLGTAHLHRKLDDDSEVLLSFAGGAVGSLLASQVCPGEDNNLTLRVFGDAGSLKWRQEDPSRLDVFEEASGWRQLRGGRDKTNIDPRTANAFRLPAGHPEGYLDALTNLYTQFAEAIDGGPPLFPGIDEGVRGVAFVEAAVSSHRTGQAWVRIPCLEACSQ